MPEKNVFGLSTRVVSWHEFGVVYYVLPKKLAHEYDASRTLILRQHRKNELSLVDDVNSPYDPCMVYLATFIININHSCR